MWLNGPKRKKIRLVGAPEPTSPTSNSLTGSPGTLFDTQSQVHHALNTDDVTASTHTMDSSHDTLPELPESNMPDLDTSDGSLSDTKTKTAAEFTVTEPSESIREMHTPVAQSVGLGTSAIIECSQKTSSEESQVTKMGKPELSPIENQTLSLTPEPTTPCQSTPVRTVQKKAKHKLACSSNPMAFQSTIASRWKSKKTPNQKGKKAKTPKKPKKGRVLHFDANVSTNTSDSEKTVQAATEAIDHLMGSVLKVLEEQKLLFDFVVLLKVISNGRLPCNNIAFLLLLERARFANLSTSTAMYYWPETLKFWKVVYKILHGKAIRLFSGMKNIGQVVTGEAKSGQYDPVQSTCNFAVPEIVTLNRITESSDVSLPKEVTPGIIQPAIDLASKTTNKEFVLCVDGKKIAPGLNKKYGDIDLWGHEAGTTLADAKARLDKESKIVNHTMKVLVSKDLNHESTEALDGLRQVATILSHRLADARALNLAQERNLDKLKRLAEKNPDNESKYDYAMSFVQTTIFQAQRFIASTLKTISQVCEIGSALNLSHHYHYGEINLCHQGNVLRLPEPSDLPEQFRNSNFTKQRTPPWFELRKLAPVTGSSLHKAIGLGILKDQRQHCDEHIGGQKRKEPSTDLQARLSHGIANEDNAVATLAATVLPFMFPPHLAIVEDGARFIKGQTKETLIEVSSDGYLLPVHGTQVGGQSLYIVEIKCPYPNKNVLPVHYKPPKYYICQLLAEMAAHETNVGLYVSYSKQSMTVCKVSFDEELWQMIMKEVEYLYGGEKVIRLKKRTDGAKQIQKRLDVFIQENVEFILEVPSCTASGHSTVTYTIENLPYLFPIEVLSPDSPSQCAVDPQALGANVSESIEEGYRLNRKKAKEILAFVLSDTDRIWSPEQPHHLPVAYALKGASITVQTVGEMVSEVREQCEKKGVHIICESYDGQWYPLVVRDSQGGALTRLQFQKDVWREALSLPKPKMMQYFRELFRSSKENRSETSITNEDGALTITSHDGSLGRMLKSWKHKVNLPEKTAVKFPKNKRNPPSLKLMCTKIVSVSYPKHLLSVRYAESIFPERLQKWETDKPQGTGVRIRGIEETISFYSFVEHVQDKGYKPKILDPSHLLVNCRVKATKDGFKGVSPQAFLDVAESDPTIVNRAIIVDALDKQSVAIAERVFSEKVEEKMIELGYESTAQFVHCIRNWYEAIDQPGLRSVERIRKLLDFKKWLIGDISFNSFPPPGRHVKGIPFVMWEGFLQNVDTRVQLYSICNNKTYNHRSLGTLAVESFFSDLTDIEPTKMGCPKAIHIPRLMASVTELNHYRHDPNR